MHRYLSALAVAAVVVHVGALLADSYIQFRLFDVFVPMASSWRPGAVAWGIVAMYLLLVVEITSLVGDWLPRRVWWSIHTTSFVLFTLGTIHGLKAGTDAANALVRIAMIIGIAEVAFVLGVRVVYRRRAWR
jgi:predicted ferric reductase